MSEVKFTAMKKIMLIVASVVAFGFLFSSFYFFDKDSNNFSVKLECIYNIDGEIYHGETGGKAWIENCDVNELVVENGTTLTFGGQANADYKFAGFYADEERLTPLTEPGETSLELPIDRNTTLFAYFAKGYELSLTLEAEEGSSVTTLTETFYHGEQVSYIHMIERHLGSEMALKYVNSLPELTEEYLEAPVNLEKVAFMMPAKTLGLTLKPSNPDIVGLSGSGTTEAPYLIASAADLRSVSTLCASTASYRSAYYSLTANIDLNPTLTNVAYNGSTGNIELTVSGTKYYLGTGKGSVAKGSWSGSTPSLTAWTPIGTSSAKFTGTFNCNSYTISGIFINSTANYQGLIGYRESASLHELYVKNSVVLGGSNTGMICGYSHGGHVNKSMTDSSCVIVGTGSVGMMFGYANYGSGAQDCINYGTVISTGQYCGGLYGQSPYNYWGGCYNSVNHGTVIGTTDVGGLMGYRGSDSNGVCVYSCVNTGSVTGTSNANAVVGRSSPVVQYCHYLSGSGGTAYGTAFTSSTVSSVVTDVNSRVPGYILRSDGYDSKTNYFYNGWVTNAAGYPTLINDTNLSGSIYYIRFDANGGSGGPGTQYKQSGVAFTIPSTTPTRTGYNFLGWNTTSTATTANATYAAGKTYTSDASLTLYAVWESMWVITFNANGGSGGPGIQYKPRNIDLILATAVPTRDGYPFVGWATTSTAKSPEFLPGDLYKNDANITLYAVWGVVGLYEGNSLGIVNSVNLAYTSSYPWTSAPASGGGTIYTSGGKGVASVTSTMSITFTVQSWDPYFYYQVSSESNYDKGYVALDSESSYKINAISGAGSYTQYTITGLTAGTQHTLYFKYTKDGSVNSNNDRFQITIPESPYLVYNANGGSGAPANQLVTSGELHTISSTKPTKPNAVFKGWAYSTSAKKADIQPGASVRIYGAITLYAVWEQYKYTVVFNSNGSATGTMNNASFTCDIEQKLPKNTFTRSGFEFLGWSTDSNATTATYTDEQSVVNLTTTNNGTVTLYAVWKPLNYTIKLYDGSTLLGTQTATYNVTLSLTAWATLLSNNSLTASTYEQYGWSFAGWSASTTATTKTYSNGQAVTDLSAPGTTINLYAIHTQTLNLTYNGNGSTGGSVSKQEISIYLNSSSKTVSTFATNLASNSFTRKHYTFSKWALGSTSGTQFAAGAAITQTNIPLTYNGSFTYTFYAIWQGNSYTINYYNGTTKVNSASYTYGTSASLKSFDSLNSAVLNWGYGWEFYGWINSTSSYTRLFADQASITTINLGDNSEITAGRTISLYAIYVRTITFVSGLHSEPTTTTAEQYWNSYSTAAANYSSVMASPPQAISNNGWTVLGYRADITASTATFTAKTATEIKPAVNAFNTLYAVYSRTITIADLNSSTTATQYYNSVGTVSTVNAD